MTATELDGPVGRDVLILGIGNILLRDEGIGVHAVRRLTERFEMPDGVAVVDGGTSGLDLLDMIAGRDHLIIVDAVAHGGPPGSMIRLAGDEIPAFLQTKISPHQLGLSDLLAVLKLTDEAPQTVALIGMQPDDLSLGLDLSRPLADRLQTMVEAIVAELASLGLKANDRADGIAARQQVGGPPAPG